ncbi:hypothetical protein A6764_00030 [Brevibacillus sp. WF146]|uniref:hypothetical protein n=1 Tax=Brevibacillus sp. WF146 TaxID=319501 RepID=UPI0007ECEB6E|nr:hypothetical protein [Brevibacillus sp. WF146]UYZ12184.1 hypothetical protein A6764_15275 [Brevibacillus sp. WF146]UYZ13433.1 hypothetical protein A6764_00030 [Brevibacillus sp. WF146]
MTKRNNRLPPAKDWRARPVETWNTASFTEYLRDRHTELYGIPYVPGRGGWRAEQGMIKRMIDEHGPEVVRRFIDGCFREYRPTREYPGVNFTFMYTYMRGRVLPKVLAEAKREVRRELAEASRPSFEELAEWL